MTEHNSSDGSADESGIDRALAEDKRLEREERDAAIARQASADERIVRALAEE